MNFKESGEGYMGGFGKSKGKEEMMWLNYNLKFQNKLLFFLRKVAFVIQYVKAVHVIKNVLESSELI